ncbi:MAG: pentapeptide repeat-containing protein, partial [Candidatus Brocadiia bacterium]
LSEPVLHLLGSPNFLWLALLCIWEDFRARPAMSLGGFLKLLVEKLSDRAAQYVLVGERKVLSAEGILRFATEIAWLNYSKGAGVDEEKCRELLWKHKLEINPSLLLRTRPAKLFDIKGGRQTHILVELPQGVVTSFLVALRFIESLEGKDLLSVLGRPISDEVYEFILEMLRVRGAIASPESEAWLRRTRDQLWGWYSLQAVAVIPKKVLSGGVVFSDIELYADFRLLCLLLCAEINLLLKDDRPLTASAPKAISLLVKSLQSNPYPGRLDFRKRLAGANLKGGEFEDVDLEGADFSGCKLEEARFRRCCLNGAKLDGASLVGAAIDNCSALKATANGADFTGCTVRYCDFSGSKMRGAKINASSFVSVSFAGASLVSVSMSKSHFSTASFENANMNVARLEKSDFNSADFSGAKLVGAHMANCTLSLCVFRKANLLIADFSGSKFSSPLLEDCDGTGMMALKSEFEDLSCYRSNFTEASLGGASLPEAKMHQVDFTNADLSGVTLKGSDVRSVQFSGANLTMASLAGAVFKDPAGLETVKLADGLDLSGSIGLEPKIRLALKRLGAKD